MSFHSNTKYKHPIKKQKLHQKSPHGNWATAKDRTSTINLELLTVNLFSSFLAYRDSFNVFLFARFVSKNCYLLKFSKTEGLGTLFGEHFKDW